MKNFVRGASVNIAVTFYDHTGAIVTPASATVTLSYVPKGQCDRSFLTYALALPTSGSAWTYDWDSSVAEPGVVFGYAATTTPGLAVSSLDFSFRLTANRANKELAGDDTVGDGY